MNKVLVIALSFVMVFTCGATNAQYLMNEPEGVVYDSLNNRTWFPTG